MADTFRVQEFTAADREDRDPATSGSFGGYPDACPCTSCRSQGLVDNENPADCIFYRRHSA